MSVATFQRAFAKALGADDTTDDAWSNVIRQPAFAVHRNNVMVACVDALAANFPTVARLVGEAFFRAMAAEFARAHLPRQPSLFDYGGEFPDFVAGFEAAASVPYLADVARVDRWWLEAHVAADAPVLTGADLANRNGSSLDRIRLRLHPAVRFGRFDQPILSIWQRNREATMAVGEVEWRAEGVLLARPCDEVDAHPIGPAAWAFLDACAHGATLAEATTRAFEIEPGDDLASDFARLVVAGAFSELED